MKRRHQAPRDAHGRQASRRTPPTTPNRARDKAILTGLAALSAFIAVYASIGHAGFVFALASAIAAGALIYLAAGSISQRKG